MEKSTPSFEEIAREMFSIQSAKDALEGYIQNHYQEMPYSNLKVFMRQAFDLEQIYEEALSSLVMKPNNEPTCNSASSIYQTIIQTNTMNETAPMPSVKMEDNDSVRQSIGARYAYKDLVRKEYQHCKDVLTYLDSLEKPSFGSKRSMTTMLQTSHLKAYLSALEEIAKLFELNLDD